MKRFLLAAFAAAVTVAWAVPSTAADVNVGLQYRLRGEMRNNQDFNANNNDNNDLWGQRVRVSANAKADDVSAKVTIQETRFWGMEPGAGSPVLTANTFAANPASTPGGRGLDVHEAYINVDNIAGQPISAKIGRQELNYGDQRLIGSFGWSNYGRSFDAIKFGYKSAMVDVDVFTSKLVDTSATTNNTVTLAGNATGAVGTGRDQDLYGVYATIRPTPDKLADLDVYFLRVTNGAALPGVTTLGTVVTGTAPMAVNTIGFRVNGAVAGADYTVEVVPYQKGDIEVSTGTGTGVSTSTITVGGMAYAIKAGYTIPGVEQKIRVGFEYDYASGDKDPADKKSETFISFWPTNHDKYGYADRQGWQNMKAWSLNASAMPIKDLNVDVAYWNFSLATEKDAWYNAAGGATAFVPATAGAAAPTAVGSEIDLRGSYKISSALVAELGYSIFMPGDFTKKNATFAGAGSTAKIANMSWTYLMLTSNF